MSSHETGRRPRTPLEEVLESLPRLIDHMEELTALMSIEQQQSSATLAALRAKSNQMLFSGMAPIDVNGRFSIDFVVPFASVAVADMNSLGNLTVTTDAMGGNSGPGTVIVTKGRFACIPLEGTHLSISAVTPSGLLFVAVYVDKQPINFGSAI